MGTKFIRGMTTGALMGMAAAMMMNPSMDRRTKRKMRRAARNITSTTGDMFNSVMGMMR
ncbi:hypothetical protein [Hathewaya massiliensis]|uniref:hypothetical protein n=1 Tax=Hathewaya massiliensis TaxID=1964382 RepID=UPI00163CAC2D|nr:hypothetical protein [Hathewaya massiliensis]